MKRFYDLEDIKNEGIKDLAKLKEYGYNVGALCLTNWGGITLAITHDGDGVFYQFYDGEILEGEVEYFDYEELEGVTHYDSKEEFDEYYGGSASGFKHGDTIYLLDEFMRI